MKQMNKRRASSSPLAWFTNALVDRRLLFFQILLLTYQRGLRMRLLHFFET